jgi:hypothetical protein
VVLTGRQKASVLVRLRGWKTCEKRERLLGFGETVFNRSPIRAIHFAFSPNWMSRPPKYEEMVVKAECARLY